MLEATGPVTAPGWNGEITADDVVDVIGRQLPACPTRTRPTPSRAGSPRPCGRRSRRATSRRRRSPPRSRAASRSGTCRCGRATPRRRRSLDRPGRSGRADLGNNPLYVVWSGVGASKVAIFAERSIATDVTLADDGTATVTTTLTLKNTAVPMPPSVRAVRAPAGLPGGHVRGSRQRVPAET